MECVIGPESSRRWERLKTLSSNGGGDIYEVAAAYAFHLAECQGFIDGNKRTAVACAAVFMRGNGCVDRAADQEVYDAMIAIAKRQMGKRELAAIFRRTFPSE